MKVLKESNVDLIDLEGRMRRHETLVFMPLDTLVFMPLVPRHLLN